MWFTDHMITVIVSVLFLMFGIEKLANIGDWKGVFEQIGLGQWFRYVTGIVQISGALLFVVPRTNVFGAALLGATMIGAVVAQMVVLGGVFDAIIPAGMLFFVVIAAAIEFADRPRA
jgi:putative oxidoreductase